MIDLCSHGLRCAALAVALAALACFSALPRSASAFTEPGYTGTFQDFANCPANLHPQACLHTYVTGGDIQIGHADVPISLPGDTLDLAWYGLGESACEPVDELYDAPGEACVLSPPHGIVGGPAQPVPGGLLGAVAGGELTDVQAKLEWAQDVPPDGVFGLAVEQWPTTLSDAVLNEGALAEEAGTGLRLAVKIHLSGPFLGSGCYIGSASEPVTLALTTGATSPPAPNTPIRGRISPVSLNPSGQILELPAVVLVDDSFSVPAASGCGSLIDAAIDAKLGLPSPAGENTVLIDAEAEQVGIEALLEHGWSESWGEPAALKPAAPEPESAAPASPEPLSNPAPAPSPPQALLPALATPFTTQATVPRPAARPVKRSPCKRDIHARRAPKTCKKHGPVPASGAKHRPPPPQPGRP